MGFREGLPQLALEIPWIHEYGASFVLVEDEAQLDILAGLNLHVEKPPFCVRI